MGLQLIWNENLRPAGGAGPPGPRGSPGTRYLKRRQIPAASRRGRRPRTRGSAQGSAPLCIRPSVTTSLRTWRAR
jgi:hypothetical protein